MNGNFLFLMEHFPALEKTGSLAESYLYADPNACIYKIGTLAETIVNYMFELIPIKPSASDNTQFNRLNTLQKLYKSNPDLLQFPNEICDMFHAIRIRRNDAVHAGYDSFEDCLTLLEMAHTISTWFMQAFGDYTYDPIPFVMPEDIRNQPDYAEIIRENEKLAAELEKAQAAILEKLAHRHTRAEERKRHADRAARNIRLSEREIRYLIDEQLRKTGWEADAINLRYSRGTRPEENRNIAIAEWPTDLALCKWGYADYALFAGLKLVGVVEVNAGRHDISAAIDNECREYSMAVKEEHEGYLAGTWGEYKVPFLFAANGRAHIQQNENKSGIWFRDARNDANEARVLQGWMAPQGLLDMLETDIAAANQRLAASPYDPLLDKKKLSFRPYQIEAVKKTEAAVIHGRRAALIVMAAGAGKTRVALGLIFRFLKTGRFKRILYLVGDKAAGGRMLGFINKYIGRKAGVCVSTVQSLAERVIYGDSDTKPSVTDFDLVILDDALDLSKGANISDYRAAIDYFDAIKIALASAPAPYVREIYRTPVFNYSYNRAVKEGYLIN